MYTDEHAVYRGIPRLHESVRHSVGEYVRDSAHTNGMESFWSMLKCGYTGNLPPDESKAPASLCGRISGVAQRPITRYGESDGGIGAGSGGQATEVR